MTPRRFDALASSTPARRFVLRLRKSIKREALRCVRLLWLAAIVDPKNSASIADYRRRFHVTAYAMQLRKHQGDVLDLVQSCLARGDALWQ